MKLSFAKTELHASTKSWFLFFSISCMVIPVFVMSYSVSPTPASVALLSPLSCIAYDPDERIIRVSCESASISDIDKSIQNPSVLHK